MATDASRGIAAADPVTSRHLAFLVTRALVIATGFAALTLFPAHPVESWQGLAFPGNNWIDGLVRWDSFWYESIVDPRPRFVPEYLSNANFFPFYSWVSWVVSLPLRLFLDLEPAFFIGGLIVSSAAFLLGLAAVDRLTTRLAGPDVSSRTVWLIAVFPFSFFFTVVYADALYFCLCAWSLTFASERRWPLACALAAMASMTRIPGVALFPALALEYVRQNPVEPGSVNLADYAGRYRSDELDVTYQIQPLGERLTLKRGWESAAPLLPIYPDGFSVQGRTIRFMRDAAGRVTGFRVFAGRALDVRFTRLLQSENQ